MSELLNPTDGDVILAPSAGEAGCAAGDSPLPARVRLAALSQWLGQRLKDGRFTTEDGRALLEQAQKAGFRGFKDWAGVDGRTAGLVGAITMVSFHDSQPVNESVLLGWARMVHDGLRSASSDQKLR